MRPKSRSKRDNMFMESVRITPANPALAAQNQKSLSPSDSDQIKAHGHFKISYSGSTQVPAMHSGAVTLMRMGALARMHRTGRPALGCAIDMN